MATTHTMSGVYRKWDSSTNWRNPVERTWKSKAKDEAGELGKSKRVVPGASKGQVIFLRVALFIQICKGRRKTRMWRYSFKPARVAARTRMYRGMDGVTFVSRGDA